MSLDKSYPNFCGSSISIQDDDGDNTGDGDDGQPVAVNPTLEPSLAPLTLPAPSAGPSGTDSYLSPAPVAIETDDSSLAAPTVAPVEEAHASPPKQLIVTVESNV